MAGRTSVSQRTLFFQRHEAGQSYRQIGADMGISLECVRYWCRRQRDGGDVCTRYARSSPGLLQRFDPKVRYAILRLRLEHPRRGPSRILAQLRKRPSLCGLDLPSEVQIGRYLHQWPRFRRQKLAKTHHKRPTPPIFVHQRWQLDFKDGIALQDGTLVNLHTVRDPVGETCLGAVVYPAGRVGHAPHKVTTSEAQATLRHCFARWGTLPQEVQTDHDTGLIGPQTDGFPGLFTLWLKGLGIEHVLTRPGRPTDNAEVERCHRTVYDYAIAGQEKVSCQVLQRLLDQAVEEMAFELPSRARGCRGRPPVLAHPEVLLPPRPFQLQWELAHFDLERVHQYLSSFVWQRTVGKTGQTYVAGRRYSVGRPYAGQQVMVTFDPADRCLVFRLQDKEVKRRPVLGLAVSDLTGLHAKTVLIGPQQLPLPLHSLSAKGVYC